MKPIKQQIKDLDTSKENKIVLTKLLHKIGRMENEKIICVNGHRFFFVNGKYCGRSRS